MDTIDIAGIRIGNRYRRKMGDLESLAKSIETQGLLQPIGITEDGELVFGERRLRACRDILHWRQITVRIVKVTSIVAGEYAENELRKDFTPSERVAIAQALEDELPERRGNPSIRQTPDELTGRTDEFVAKQAGFGSRQTFRDAKRVVEHGLPELIHAMDTGKVRISTAAKLASLPSDQQSRLLDLSPAEIRQAARSIRDARKASEQNGSTPPLAAPQAPISRWTVTLNHVPVPCHAVIAFPPFRSAGEDWRDDELQAFTREWCSRWSACGARYFAVGWRQELLYEGRRWMDEALYGYRFVQLLAWHVNYPLRRFRSFDPSWMPILLYQQPGSAVVDRAHDGEADGRLDCFCSPCDGLRHASEIEPNRGVMHWLIRGLTNPGETIGCLFGGLTACGGAAIELRRRFHGVALDSTARVFASERIAAASRHAS